MGSLRDLFERMPFFSGMAENINVDDYELVRIRSMIESMTEKERRAPDLMQSKSRQQRVARGSGREMKDVADLMQRFTAMQTMMGRLGQNTGWMSKIPGLKQIDAMRQMKNMDLNEVFGSIMEQATTPQQAAPQLPPGLPPGYVPPGFRGQVARKSSSDKKKKKRKLGRKDRKRRK